MQPTSEDRLHQLNKLLDRMLADDDFRQKAAHSGLEVLAIAARLIETDTPTLSTDKRQAIKAEVLSAVDDAQHTEAYLTALPPLELPDSMRTRIHDKMMNAHHAQNGNGNSTPDSTLPDATRERIRGAMETAQQQLQIDQLVISDEALNLARRNDDPIVQTAIRLRTAAHPQLSQVGYDRIRNTILPASAPEKKRLIQPGFIASLQRLAAAIVILLFISALAVPPASAESVPGDPLYGMKRTLETISLQWTRSDSKLTRTHLRHMHERISELDTVTGDRGWQIKLLDDAHTSLEKATEVATAGRLLAADSSLKQNFDDAILAVKGATDRAKRVLDDETVATYFARQDVIVERVDTTPALVTLPQETPTPEVRAPATPAPTATPEGVPADTMWLDEPLMIYVATGNNRLNVREGPSTSTMIIGQLGAAESVAQLAQVTNSAGELWVLVDYDEGLGWLSGDFISEVPVTPVTIVEDDPASPADEAVINNSPSVDGQSPENRADQDTPAHNGGNNGNDPDDDDDDDDDDDNDDDDNDDNGRGNAYGHDNENRNPNARQPED